MDAAIPFNVPVDPTALRLPVSGNIYDVCAFVCACVCCGGGWGEVER